MLKATDIVCIEPTPDQIAYAKEMAVQAEIGGVSQVRKKGRGEFLSTDQLVGQLGQLALSLYWFGSDWEYRKTRYFANIYKTRGDGGSDMAGANVDVKTSLMRTSQDPLSYNMIVRPAEFDPKTVYILALIKNPELPKIGLIGWAMGSELVELEKFKGAVGLKADELHPLPKIKWSL